MKVESAAGLEGAGDELAVEALFVSSTSIISHAEQGNQLCAISAPHTTKT